MGWADASFFVPLWNLLRAICDSEGGGSFVCPVNVVMDVYDPSGGGLELRCDYLPSLNSRNWSLVRVQTESALSTFIPHSLSFVIQQVNNVIFWMMLELRCFALH